MHCDSSARLLTADEAGRILGVSPERLAAFPVRAFDLGRLGIRWRAGDVLSCVAAIQIVGRTAPATRASPGATVRGRECARDNRRQGAISLQPAPCSRATSIGDVWTPRSIFAGPITQAERNAELSRRARSAWGPWLDQWHWTHYATLTFAMAVSQDTARSAATVWLDQLDRMAGSRVGHFAVIEMDASGQPHIHALLCDWGGLTCKDVRSLWGWGFTKVDYFDPSKGAAFYVTKQLGAPSGWQDFAHYGPYRHGSRPSTAAPSPVSSRSPRRPKVATADPIKHASGLPQQIRGRPSIP